MKNTQISLLGGILFFFGLILILISWHFSYPISFPELNDITFIQFYPSIWPGIVFSLVGLFLAGYFSEKKSVKILCTATFPLVLYSYSFYFSYLSSSDSGAVRAMFEVFHRVGINSEVVPYFQYPIYFNLNEIASQILGVGVKELAIIFVAFFGILIGVYLFLFLSKGERDIHYKIAFLGVLLYFSTIYLFLNYQWVPQTLAFVFFLLLLVFFDHKGLEYRLMTVIVFTVLVFTHIFIPAMFLLFLGLYILKKKESGSIFLLLTCIYLSVLISYTTYYFPIIVDTVRESIFSFGRGGYSAVISKSFRESPGLLNEIISMANRIRIPLTWVVVSMGFLMLFIKKKVSVSPTVLFLAISSGIYLGVGVLFPILGMRALQILLIPLLVGIVFFYFRWKKSILAFVIILIILSVFGPMRTVYDQTQYQLDEEVNACNFLAKTLPEKEIESVAIGQVNWGYFTTVYRYIKGVNPSAIRPGNSEFFSLFIDSIEKNEYVFYNSNLGKEIITYGGEQEYVYDLSEKYLLNNKLYECGRTFIVTGQ